MGKLSPSVRSLIPTTARILKKPPPPASSPSPRPHYFPSHKKPKRALVLQRPPNELPTLLFSSPDLQQAKARFNSLLLPPTDNPTITTRYYNSILQSYASISTLDDSISFLGHMIKTAPSSFSPNLYTFHILLSHSCKTPDNNSLSLVQKTLNFMLHNGFQPTQVTVDLAVRSLCAVDRPDDAVSVVKELSLKHAKPDTFTYNFLVKCLCKTRSLADVYGFIDEMKNLFDMKPDLVTYTILIDNVCNSKNLREALRLVGALKDCGFKPDCFVYNTIMKGYCKLGKGGEVIGVYKKMKEEGVEPDLVTYNTLIFGLAKSGRVKEGIKYLKIMVESGFGPDAVTYTSLMNGMCREGDQLGALALLEEMEGKGCSPNSCTYNTLLHGLCKGRFLDKGVELYRLMKEGGIELETDSYAALVRAFCREGRVAEAYKVFDYAVESKSLTDVAAYSTLESTLKWLKKAREQGLSV